MEKHNLDDLRRQVVPVTFAVFINLLDAVTFGSCFFPAVLGNYSSLAIDLFLFSTVVVQVVFLLMSDFNYGLGTSMAENIPFIRVMALGVYDQMKSKNDNDINAVEEMFPTIMATLCVSTALNGLLFFLIGYFGRGYVLHYFPRHVILGITFGFGIFMLEASFQVTTGLQVSFDWSFLEAVSNIGSNSWIQVALCVLVSTS